MAKPVIIDIQHDLSPEEARTRVESGFGRIRDSIAPKGVAVDHHWEDDTLRFSAGAFGQTIGGRIQVLENMIRLEVDLPWLLSAMAEPLQKRLKSEIGLLLEKK